MRAGTTRTRRVPPSAWPAAVAMAVAPCTPPTPAHDAVKNRPPVAALDRPQYRRLHSMWLGLQPVALQHNGTTVSSSSSSSRISISNSSPHLAAATHTPALDPPGAASCGLSQAEAAFFKAQGFLCKRGLIPRCILQPHVTRIMVELQRRQPSISGVDASTWVDPHRSGRWRVTTSSLTADGRPSARNWPMSFSAAGDWRWHGIGAEPRWLDATSAHENVLHTVECLIGGPVKRPARNRGIYCLFPKSESELPNLSPHHDYHPMDLGGMIYLSEIGAHSGGTTLWPGSHLDILRTLPHEQRFGFQPTSAYHAAVQAAKGSITPVEIIGSPGDVLFFHPALLHSGGVNSAADGNGQIRISSPQDFQRSRPDKTFLMYETSDGRRVSADGTIAADAAGHTVTQDGATETRLIWHHDTLEYAAPPATPLGRYNIWADWNLAEQAGTPRDRRANVVRERSWWDKHGVESVTPTMRLDELASWDATARVWRLLVH